LILQILLDLLLCGYLLFLVNEEILVEGLEGYILFSESNLSEVLVDGYFSIYNSFLFFLKFFFSDFALALMAFVALGVVHVSKKTAHGEVLNRGPSAPESSSLASVAA
jgi:hypothetical protein